MDSNLRGYDLIIIDDLTFYFITESGDEYKCYFLSYAEYFSAYPEIASKVFAFNLELLNPQQKHKGLDKRIADTVITIITNFLSSHINAVVYVCDTSDKKEKARFRKFKSCFNYYEQPGIIQVNGSIDIGGIVLYNALLVHKANKLMNKFVEAFLDLNSNEGK